MAPAGRSRTLRLTWLDTFDWRLHQAGLTLVHAVGSRVSDYTLTGDDGDQISGAASSVRWPALASALPPGPLRARLEPVTSIRALLPVARAVSTVRQLRALNDDLKTIAWLTVEHMSLPGPDPASLPARLAVTAVRGYQSQADRIIRALTEAGGLTPAAQSPLDAVLAAAGRRPGDYTGKVNVELTAAMPARCAMQTVLLALLDTLEANVPGTMRDIDTEFLHDLRVAVRRTRSALKLCRRRAAGRGRREVPRASSSGSATSPPRPATSTSTCSTTAAWWPACCRRHRPSWPRSTTISPPGARPSTPAAGAGAALAPLHGPPADWRGELAGAGGAAARDHRRAGWPPTGSARRQPAGAGARVGDHRRLAAGEPA